MKTIENKVKELVYLDLTELNPFQGTLKDLSKENYNKLRKQILGGFKAPFFVWRDPSTNKYMLEDGHQRYRVLTELKAAEKYEIPKLPCVVIHADSEHEAKKNILEISSQFGSMSSSSLFEFASLNNIDLPTLEDFRFPEIDLDSFKKEFFEEPIEGQCDEDEVPEVVEPKSKLGDLYILGEHRLLCGDSTNIKDVERLMDRKKADMVFTDPPYGMNYSGRGSKTSNKILNDNIDPKEFYNLMPEVSERYIWGRVENYKHLLIEPRDTIIWKKNNFGMGVGYRGQYEVCFYYGTFSGSDSDVWECKKDSNYEHPTQKPVELCERAIKNSDPKTVLDLFGGSGSTLIACEKTNRKCFMMELDPKYCDVIVARWEKYTGKTAELVKDAY